MRTRRVRPRPKHQFTIYRDTTSGWRWRLKSPNGKIVADSGESYARVPNVRAAIAAMCRAIKGGLRPTLLLP